MTKFYFTLTAVAALLAAPVMSSSAFAETDFQNAKASAGQSAASETKAAALDAPAETSTARKINLQAEPIEQTQNANEPESQPADQSDAAPKSTDTAAEAPAASSETTAGAAEPQTAESKTAKRICRKFSAAIAMVIEVPCE